MKLHWTYLLVVFGVLSSCQEKDDSLPNDLNALKKLKTEKRAEIKTIESVLVSIDSLLAVLDPASVEERIVLVKADTIKSGVFNRFLEVQGAVEPEDEVMISAEVGGRLTSVTVKEGQKVKRGQLIARVNLETINKQKAEISTALSLASQVYDKQKRLWDQKIGSELQYLQAKNNKERLEKSLEALDFEMTKANVYAPISGVVQNLFMKSGETVAPGTPIVKVLNDRKLVVAAQLPEQLLPKVRKGDLVQISIPALSYEEDHQVSFISSVVDPANRTFTAEVNVKNRNGLVKPNLLATMRVVEETIEDAVVIPVSLVQQEVGGRQFVYVIKNSEGEFRAEKRAVVLGDSYNDKVVIVDGLSANEVIVTTGSRDVANGTLLNIND